MRRRSLQFSLRGLLLTLTLFAVWLGWFVERAMRQKEALALLNAWGATINYGHKWQGPFKPLKKVPAPGWAWLRKLIGSNFFDEVVNIELITGRRLFTAEEEAVARRGGAAPLPSRLLELADRDFTALAGLPDLRWLRVIGDFRATDGAIRRLGRLKKLEILILNNTSGRSTGGVTDESLTLVNNMPRLTELYLEGNPITDAGLANVRWPAGLAELDLSGTRLTDASLEHLKKLTTLRRLVLLDTRVTDAGVAKLRAALPNCVVRRRAWDQD